MGKNEIITVENCLRILKAKRLCISGDITAQVAAWSVVYDYCEQNGMPIDGKYSDCGIENVIAFLEKSKVNI